LAEEEKEASPELEIEEFLRLSEVAPERKGKTTDKEVLEFVATKAKTCSDIAKNCGDVSYSAMHARLKRLMKKKKVMRRYKEGNAYWVKTPAGMAPAEEESEEEGTEIEEGEEE